jgi:hypothetical protein
MGTGVDLTGVTDAELLTVLARSSALVDSYCCIPLLPQKFDFKGGTMTGEQHEWPADAYDRPAPYRYWPWAKPVQSISSFRIYATPNVYVEVNPDDMYINNSGGWIEVSSLVLTQYGVFGAGVVQSLIGMYHPVAVATYAYGWTFPVVQETLAADSTLKIYSAVNQYWTSATVTVYKNGVLVSSGYTVDRTEGRITFASAQGSTDIITCSYTYSLPWQIAQATALIAADDFGERSMRSRGMSGVDSLTVGEITIRRTAAHARGVSIVESPISARAQELLSTFVIRTVR